MKDALELLRAADPAAGVDVSWTGAPPLTEAPLTRTPRTERRGRALIAVAAVAVLVAGVAIAVAAIRNPGPSTTSTAATQPPPSFLRPGQTDPHTAQNAAYAAKVFAELPVLPGAERRTSAPYPALRELQVVPGTGARVVRRVGWWVWSGTEDAAWREFTRRLPAGFTNSGSSGPINGVTIGWFNAPATAATADLSVGFSLLQLPRGIAVRADVVATPIPSRTVASFVPPPTSVTVTYTVQHLSPKRATSVFSRTVRGAAAQDLADRVNRLVTDTFPPASCPMSPNEVGETLEFHTTRGTFALRTAGCLTLTLTLPSGAFVPLLPGDLLDHVREDVLGLPKDWGIH